MTTALQPGNVQAAIRPRACILILAPQGGLQTDFVADLERRGHGVVASADIRRLDEEDLEADLVLVHHVLADDFRPHGDRATFLLVPEGSDIGPSEFRFHGVLPLPLDTSVVSAMARMAVELRRYRNRCASLEIDLEGLRDGSGLVGCSPVMRRLSTVIRRAADSEATILIEGQPGSGKSLVARTIHARSRRSDKPLNVLPGAAVDEAEMVGALRSTDGGTLLIEDVDQLPSASQGALVRHLKERSSASADSQARMPRILATTSARLPELVAHGGFREDLFYRLHVFPVVVPMLRERREDIPLLVRFFQERHVDEGRPASGFTASAMILLESLPWPGNVSQLENVIRRALVLAGESPVDRSHLLGPATGLSVPAPTSPEQEPDDDEEVTESSIRPIQEEEKRLLSRALRATKGNVRRAAQLLGIGRATLYRKIQQYRLRLN